MRILVLCYEYPPIGGGGGRVAQSVAEQMVARGHEVRVQTAALRWKSVHETIGDVDVFRTASGRRAPDTCRVHEMGAYCATSLFPALRHTRRWKPDVIHAHFAVPTGFLAWSVHQFTGVPYVVTAHLGDVPGGVPEQTDTLFKIVDPLARLVWKRAAACTAVSSFVQTLAERRYGRQVVRILNGIDLTDSPVPSPEVERTRHLVFVGRFSVQKNPLFLLDVLSQLRDQAWRLTLIGDGPLMPEAQQRITQYGLRDRVTATGWLEAVAVQRILHEADILCMPSLSEGLPVAAIEALKHGLAIVASDIPGVRDVVEQDVNGCLLPTNDVNAFAHKLRWLLTNSDALFAMKRASTLKAKEFDLTAIADQYERVLQEAAGTR